VSLPILILFALFQSGSLLPPLPEANQITVIDGGKPRPYKVTEFDAGPAVGNGLNGHFFPSLIAYNTGQYTYALADFTYVIRSHHYFDENPRKAEFLSVSHYLRGMIYLYHANGVGRHALAKADFEAAINWNPANYMAHLELSRVYSDLGFAKQATSVIKHLLELKPTKDMADEAEEELKKLSNTNPE
jgi:tetratricopeptide (TPR) repeat protein